MIDKCPVCDGRISESRLQEGFVFCERGHLVTYAPLDDIDLRNLEKLAADLQILRSSK